jgi:DNA-binding LytR/AlgR family response regulator
MITRCVIVEDEPLAVERLTGYVRALPFLELAGTFESAADALTFVKAHSVELVFLDIRLGGWSGLDLLETGAIRSKVVLTTAHAEYAVRAFELAVVDYLVKPFTFERFVQAVERATAPTAVEVPPAGTLFVKTERRLERVPLGDLLYIEGQRDYRRIHLTDRRIMTLETFGELERRIPAGIVCRVHKSFMVALGRIESLEHNQIVIGGATIPVSDSYRPRLLALMGIAERRRS